MIQVFALNVPHFVGNRHFEGIEDKKEILRNIKRKNGKLFL
jgi:hypothetical protein